MYLNIWLMIFFSFITVLSIVMVKNVTSAAAKPIKIVLVGKLSRVPWESGEDASRAPTWDILDLI